MTTNPTTVLLTDDDGMPLGFIDPDQITAQATRLAYDVAEHAGDHELIADVLEAHLNEAGTEVFGYVSTAALRILAEHVLDPVLQVTDRLHSTGHLGHDLRAGLADAARNARESLT